MRLTVLPWLLWFFILSTVVWATHAYAAPRLKATQDDVTVFLWDDKCELTNHITNLPYKATWEEKGKVFQGCWGPRPDLGVAMAYFEDKTVGLIPLQGLVRVQGT